MTRKCPFCASQLSSSSGLGYFVRSSDKKRIQRYLCSSCNRSCSQATFHKCYRQKKRRLNPRIREFLASGMSQRRIAILLNISRTTVSRKVQFLARCANRANQQDFQNKGVVSEFQFDDLETFEHTKLKPVSVTIAVEKGSRRILGFEVSRMPAKGLLARKSRKKYGRRVDERPQARQRLFERISPKVAPQAIISSDSNPHYKEDVKIHFPSAIHITTLGRRGCVVGQGELKAGGFDPLFSLNHTFAMYRANMNRLFRRTWCTSKTLEGLRNHLEIYTWYHNNLLLLRPT